MRKDSAIGICALCLQNRRLCKSHYLGAAIHRLAGLNDPAGQIVLTPKLVAFSPNHLTAHLLCQDCEQRFSKLGEAPIVPLLRHDDSFPLLDKMNVTIPLRIDGPITVFSGSDMGADTDALAYFALSLAWRGAVRNWKTIKRQTTGISLGPYQEPIRLYLAGQAEFPSNVSVIAAVCSDTGSQLMVNAPWIVETDDGHLQVEILVRGVWFHILAGTGVPDRYFSLCLMRSPKRSIFLKDCSQHFLMVNRHFLETAEDQVSGHSSAKRRQGNN